ncbi:MAG: hypothetical protein WC777_03280 [Candidatus Gracilibacteria bacterium]|jgi:hypothetical protein
MSRLISSFHSLFLRNEKLSMISLGGVVGLSLLAMGIVSLTSLNDKAMKGYLLNKLENERQELVSDGEITEMLTLRARSMNTVEEQVTHMVKPAVIDYIMPMNTVAQTGGPEGSARQ